MSSSQTEIDLMRDRLIETYHALSQLDQCIIQLFSVAYEPMRLAVFPIAFQRTGIRDKRGKPINASKLIERVSELLEAGLLVPADSRDPCCNPLMVEYATRDAVQARRFEVLANAVQDILPIHSYGKNGPYYFTNQEQLIRQIRISFYRQNMRLVERYYESYLHNANYVSRRSLLPLSEILLRICSNPFDAGWFKTLPPAMYETSLQAILEASMWHLKSADEAFALLQEEMTKPERRRSPLLKVALVEQHLLRGNWPAAQTALQQAEGLEAYQREALQGMLAFVLGDEERAIAHFTAAHRTHRKLHKMKTVILDGLGDVFYILTFLKAGTPEQLQLALQQSRVNAQYKNRLQDSALTLNQFIAMQMGDMSYRETIRKAPIERYTDGHSIQTLVKSLVLFWTNREEAKKRLPRLLDPLYEAAAAAGYHWLALEAAQILSILKPRSAFKDKIEALRPEDYGGSLAHLVPYRETWELSLQALTQLRYEPPVVKGTTEKRLVWFVAYDSSRLYTFTPREQKINSQGSWSRGRPIALKRLRNDVDLDYLTPQDQKITTYLTADYTGGYYWKKGAIAALIGHPLVFWEEAPSVRVDVVKGEPELRVQRDAESDRLILQLFPDISNLDADEPIVLDKETPTRLRVVEVSDDHRHIAQIIGYQNRLEVPLAAEEQVLAAINAVSGIVTVQSDVGGGATDAEEVPADSIPHVHLLPAGDGLKVALRVRPFGAGGPYIRPGQGGSTMIAEIDGKRLQTTRNLAEENERANELVADCPTLTRNEEEGGEWLLPDPEDCLELLTELHAIGVGDAESEEKRAILEWPEGEKMRVNSTIGASQFKLSIRQQKDWFEASGEVQLPDGQVMAMQQLMELLQNSPGRFLKVGEGQFLALTETFRKRLDEFRRFSDVQGDRARFHPLAAVTLQDFAEEVGHLKTDKHWKAHTKRLKEMAEINPQMPSTLQAELRDYQIDGFKWLARLAHWGVGACLADDMGLGKTLQALAIILTRAPQGPTLVVAPTSVGMNWLTEAERFAPTLKPMQFGSGDRQKVLDDLQPFDVLVCSYGLLQQEEVADMLAKVQWETIVLDEAQAIKNMGTKRSQAAMNLQGGFKIITTGTPIENHLGELWNLFRFINPGLLGSLEKFNERFATPIERYQDKDARHQLKKLIQPFILRRTKSQVLSELPSRTEILLHVELSSEEMAFYEALRREAMNRLAESTAQAGAKHLQVLAEIMKLRRACCNPRLVMSNAPVSSSKLDLFGDVLEELLSNHHKALVFSQFVDHLHILRDYLEDQEIPYQYLDGSTPAKERKKRVDAFQAGEGDVFLISLKAGGTGLNLTAADYVIHMDPWWNPAVEDQASDRAHRIGQKRPVTIYRLVAKGTIEDKIVDLHTHKRDLADSLLEGTEMSGKMSTDELLTLISKG
ncbi:MAG: DEAD/DEAH box helicase [Cyanobacteria bacterium J06638_20]